MSFVWDFRALPVYLILLIYLPAACLGHFLFKDEGSQTFLVLLAVFSVTYWLSYPLFSRLYRLLARTLTARCRMPSSSWRALAVLSVLVYACALVYAASLADSLPLLVALKGGSVMDIAHSRSQFLAGLESYQSLLRYAVFILGRAIMPLVLVAAFMMKARYRHVLLALLIVFSLLAMEKAAPIFMLLPLLCHFALGKCWRTLAGVLLLMIASVVLVSFLAMGANSTPSGAGSLKQPAREEASVMMIPPGMPIDRAMGHPARSLLPYYLHEEYGQDAYLFNPATVSGKLTLLLNRTLWVPYITAYDWLAFQRLILEGRTTMGRSISLVHLLHGEPKMPLEKMVYVFEYGPSPGGEGASNTVFFVDAKLAFGWPGVIVYCLIFTWCAAFIFTSGSRVLMVSSIACFLVAAVSSLTATLLSGGLFIYVVLALLWGNPPGRKAAAKEPGK